MGTDNKVIRFKNKKEINWSAIVLLVILLYLIIAIGLYLTKPHVSVYEVREGSILKDRAYVALALREETTVYAKESGYINYYAQSNSKVRKGNNIYSLSKEKLVFEDQNDIKEVTLSEEQQFSLFLEIQDFNNHFSNQTFSDVYLAKANIEDTLQNITNQSKEAAIRKELKKGTLDNTKLYKTKDDGIISYNVDGLESLSVDGITEEHLKKPSRTTSVKKNNTFVSSGEPLYKLITSEKWQLYFEITEETYQAVSEKNYVKVRFKKDSQEVWAKLTTQTLNNKHYILLELDNSMVRYAEERYIDIFLILEDESGLKIPKSAETSKEFFVVPKEYITQGGNSNENGVLCRKTNKDGTTVTEFIRAEIYHEDKDVAYLDPNVFQENTLLVKPESQETIMLGEKRVLQGVYQVNKGYAIFKQIHILCESDEYYIVEEGSDYGLANYDHIVLDSTETNENEIIY